MRVFAFVVLIAGCTHSTMDVDGGHRADAGQQADAGRADAGTDSGRDSGRESDSDGGADSGSPTDGGQSLPCEPLPASGTVEVEGLLDLTWRRPTGSTCPSALASSPSRAAAIRFCNDTDAPAELRVVAIDTASFMPGTLVDPLLAAYAGATLPSDFADCLEVNDDEVDLAPGALIETTVAAHDSIVVMVGDASSLTPTSYYLFYNTPD